LKYLGCGAQKAASECEIEGGEAGLGIFGFLRRKPKVRTAADLGRFIEENAAFLMQKGLFEYSRARAGHYAKVLFSDPGFTVAMDESRWRAFPLGLALVAEMVDGMLRPFARDNGRTLLDALSGLVISIFDRYPVPAALGPDTWRDLRADLVQRLDRIGTHPPKRVMDIPTAHAQLYWDLMPIHEKLRTRDLPTTTNYLRVQICNIHDDLVKRMDPAAMADNLRAIKAA
jgi:hypothetical protein